MPRTMMSVVITVLAWLTLAAAAPQQIHFQGHLADTEGNPLTGSHSLTFRLYDAANGGTPVWTETHNAVDVENGIFSVKLGSVTALADPFEADRWLGVQVGADSEMSPRHPVLAVAHAYRVGTVDGASGGTVSGKLNVGTANLNPGTHAMVAGQNNRARGPRSVVGGGGGSQEADSNSAIGDFSVVAGGRANHAAGHFSVTGGGWLNRTSGFFGTIGGGYGNSTTNDNTTIGGGNSNVAGGFFSTIGGGGHNRARGFFSTIAGGGSNLAADSNSSSGLASAIGGGARNVAAGPFTTVGGGTRNRAWGDYSVIGGGGGSQPGDSNSAVGQYAVIAGGRANHSPGQWGVIAGGQLNYAGNDFAAIGGGWGNLATANDATISGGVTNEVSGFRGTVGGGAFNKARGSYSVVGGGGGITDADSNLAAGDYSVVAGGRANFSTGPWSAIGGGQLNRAGGATATVSGGYGNNAPGNDATICGGSQNWANGFRATVCGGFQNGTNADYTWAAGRSAAAGHTGSFVWGSSSSGFETQSFNSHTVTFRGENGARFYTHPSATNVGVRLPAGGGAWENLCDINEKNLYGGVNTAALLEKVVALPLHRWSYKSQDASIQHIGPTAQDFHAAFGLGEDNTTISTLDPDGVLFAAVQELARVNSEKDRELSALRGEIAELRRMVQTISAAYQHTQNHIQPDGSSE